MINPYATGATIYNAGSSAATSGTVDPMGYINRGLNPSQKRAGLASAALKRVKEQQIAPPQPRTVTPLPQITQTQTQPNNAPLTGVAVGAGGDTPSTPVALPQQPQQPQAAPPPLVGISPAGQVTLNLPFDYDLAEERTQGLNQYNTLLNSLNDALYGLETNNYQQSRDLDYSQQDDQRGDLNRFAARGLARSSGYGQEVADSTRSFSNMRNDLLSALTQGRTSIENQRGSGAQAFNDLLTILAREQAQRAAAKAGDLHLNDPAAPTPVPATPTTDTGVPQTPKPTTPTPGTKVPGIGGATSVVKPKLPPKPKPKTRGYTNAQLEAAKKRKAAAAKKPPIGAIKKF